MAKQRTEITRSSHLVKLTIRQFLSIDHRDNMLNYGDERLISMLENVGCTDVEYNGHFGAHIYYSLCAERDTPELRDKIEKAIIMFAARRPIFAIKQKLGLS